MSIFTSCSNSSQEVTETIDLRHCDGTGQMNGYLTSATKRPAGALTGHLGPFHVRGTFSGKLCWLAYPQCILLRPKTTRGPGTNQPRDSARIDPQPGYRPHPRSAHHGQAQRTRPHLRGRTSDPARHY